MKAASNTQLGIANNKTRQVRLFIIAGDYIISRGAAY
jgi:hypothetical protein